MGNEPVAATEQWLAPTIKHCLNLTSDANRDVNISQCGTENQIQDFITLA